MPVEVLQRYDPYRGPFIIGDFFTVAKTGRTVRCQISTHVLGWEVRLIGASPDGFEWTQVCRSDDEVLTTCEQWKAAMQATGWQ